jgi:hypothetical protein
MKQGTMKQHDDSRSSTFKSGGQRIDDHTFWAGAPSESSVFPNGPHKTKNYKSADGAGMLPKYEQTSEQIEAIQDVSEKKIMEYERNPQYRN